MYYDFIRCDSLQEKYFFNTIEISYKKFFQVVKVNLMFRPNFFLYWEKSNSTLLKIRFGFRRPKALSMPTPQFTTDCYTWLQPTNL